MARLELQTVCVSQRLTLAVEELRRDGNELTVTQVAAFFSLHRRALVKRMENTPVSTPTPDEGESRRPHDLRAANESLHTTPARQPSRPCPPW